MRIVSFTMSLAGTLSLLCCVLFFRLFGNALKAKWRRALLILTMAFYLFPLAWFKFILLRGAWALHLISGTGAASSGTGVQISNAYMVFTDAAGRRFYSEAQSMVIVISYLLLTASALILLYHIVNYARVMKAVRKRSMPAGAEESAMLEGLQACMGIRRRIRLAQSETVAVPVVSGVFSPVILLPGGKCTDNRVLKSMLLHELAHIKHQDILLQWGGLLVVALHWFNPFSYLLFHLLTEANEQYSDAQVVHKLSEQGKRRYCEDLIDYSERAGMGAYSMVMLGFSKNAKKHVKCRIDEVLNKKRKRSGLALFAGALALLMGTASAFVYQPPVTMRGALPDAFINGMLFKKDVDISFESWNAGANSETPVFAPFNEAGGLE